VSHLVIPLVRGIWYTQRNQMKEDMMKNLNYHWTKYGTSRNVKAVYILLTLAALAVASGAPGAGSGIGGIGCFFCP